MIDLYAEAQTSQLQKDFDLLLEYLHMELLGSSRTDNTRIHHLRVAFLDMVVRRDVGR